MQGQFSYKEQLILSTYLSTSEEDVTKRKMWRQFVECVQVATIQCLFQQNDWEVSEKVRTGPQIQSQAAGSVTLYVLWVTGETPCVRTSWMLKGPDNDWTNDIKEKGYGTEKCRDLTADLAINGVKLDRCLVVSLWLIWFVINSSLRISPSHCWMQG